MFRWGVVYRVGLLQRGTVARLGFCLGLGGLVVAMSACDEVDSGPSKPSPSLAVAATFTSTELERIGIRVDLGLRVDMGQTELAEAAALGGARAEVCVNGSCASQTLAVGRRPGGCDTAVGGNSVEMAAAWLDQNVIGVSFCVPTQTTVATYETVITDGSGRSNAISTSCGIVGGFLECTSQ